MKSAVAMIAALLCAASVGAFVVPVGRPCSARQSSTTSARRTASTRRGGFPVMSSVATPPTQSSATTQEDSNVQALRSHDDYLNAMAEHNDKLVVIKFYDQFCRACDEISPRFVDLARSRRSRGDAIFYELEFSSSKDLCKQLGIRRLPTVQIYDGSNGRVADLPAGPSRFSQVEDRFAELVAPKASTTEVAQE